MAWRRWRNPSRKAVGLVAGFRSGLEEANAEHLKPNQKEVRFEQVKVKYLVPATERTYTPDFELDNGIIVETKGRFEPQDRAKHLFIKLQHPTLDIRFVFQNPNARISKGSNTTYAMWADHHGYKWAKKLIPVEWMKEPPRDVDDGKRGARTIAVPAAAKDYVADIARQPLNARARAAHRGPPVAGKKKRSP